MTKSNLFRQAHRLTREDAKVYININYRVQFGLNLKALYSNENMENIIKFHKNGLEFSFKNLNTDYNTLKLYWKVEGEGVEEGSKKDGSFYYNARFQKGNDYIRLNFILNGKKVNGVKIDKEFQEKLETLIDEIKEEKKNIIEKYSDELVSGNKKIKFVAVGCDYIHYSPTIEIEEKYKHFDIYSTDIIDKAIDKMGVSKNWEYLKHCPATRLHNVNTEEIFYETLENCLSKVVESKNKQIEKINKLIEKAKETGEKQQVSTWIDECDDDSEDCDIDTVIEYIDENGTRTIERHHNW